MPYMIAKRGDEWCVYKEGEDKQPEGESLGCHATEGDAINQLRALYANDDNANKTGDQWSRRGTMGDLQPSYTVVNADGEYKVFLTDVEQKPIGESLGSYMTADEAASYKRYLETKANPNSNAVYFGAPMEVKNFSKVSGDDAWEVEGYPAAFGDVEHPDRGGDAIIPGGFDRALSEKGRIAFLFAHNPERVLGIPRELKQDDYGLYGVFRISRTQEGQDARTLLQDGALAHFSIGYRVYPQGAEFVQNKSGRPVRLLKQVNLMEASLVPYPMNPEAIVTSVKTWLHLYGNGSDAFSDVVTQGSPTMVERAAQIKTDLQVITDTLKSLAERRRELTDTKRQELKSLEAMFADLDAVRTTLQQLTADPTIQGAKEVSLRLAKLHRRLRAEGILED